MKTVSIFGSTGSVGKAAVDVIAASPDKFQIDTLTGFGNVGLLADQAIKLNAQLAVIGDEKLYPELKERLSCASIETAAGEKAICDAASRYVDIAIAAILGMAGLKPIMAALGNAKAITIANKEPIVAAGKIVLEEARKKNTIILPLDSEHNAIFQVFEKGNKEAVTRLILTASGGPFREWPLEKMAAAKPEEALAHPNWSMGAKISIDSATMMNKGLEIIEAHHLFQMPPEKIDVLVHPQSIIHSMVEYADGSVLAQMGASDMRVPITHALGWPERIAGPAQRLDFNKISALTFERVDHRRFPAINYAYHCLKAGGEACLALNAANEVAVAAYLERRIVFGRIFETVREAVEARTLETVHNLEDVFALDTKVRNVAEKVIVDCNI
jgi:1-deoxy-D-xylulose-5-phosphate reductoisomerase